jgi:hypothetical protein
MNAKHLDTLTKVLVIIRTAHVIIDIVGDELQRAYDDQSGESRFTAEGDAAGEEITTIEEIAAALENTIKELRQFVFLLSENPDFATIMREDRGLAAPLPDKGFALVLKVFYLLES